MLNRPPRVPFRPGCFQMIESPDTETTQNNVTFRDGGVGVRIYLGNILIVNNIAEIGGKGFARPFCKIVSPYCFISFHVKAIVKTSTAGKDRNNFGFLKVSLVFPHLL